MTPAALESFWAETRTELDRVPLNALIEEVTELGGRDFTTWRVAFDSYQGTRLRGWFSVPNDPPPSGRFPGVLAVPGYAREKVIPTHLVISGFAVLTLFPRGQGESHKEWELEHSTKLTYHVTDKTKLYYRGGYMDCVRGMDFLCQRTDVDHGRVGMWSRSQGGGFTCPPQHWIPGCWPPSPKSHFFATFRYRSTSPPGPTKS